MQLTRYNLPLKEWDEKKKDVVQILVERALMPEPTPITYVQLCQRMKSPPVGDAPQNSNELRGLLEDIDRCEASLGHGMLTSFVFSEDAQTRQPHLPGKGFFSLAEKLGYRFGDTEVDRLQFAFEQMQRVTREQSSLRAKSSQGV